jgi:peptide/nickel transport system permease protein
MGRRRVIGKILASVGTLVFVVVFNFFLFRVVEADPVANLYRGRNLTEEQREELRQEFGLDGSQAEQFGRYVAQTARLNLGRSYTSNDPVTSEIARRAWATVALVGVSALLAALIGTLIGIVAAWRRGSKTDYASTGFTMATYSMPDFWLGMLLLLVFAVGLGWFPVGGLVDPGTGDGLERLLDMAHHMALPAATLTIAYLGEYALIMRSSLLETMREDYLLLARAKGLRDVSVRNRHAVPNALLPVTTLFAINLGFVLSGAIAVETIFSWPGLGLATFEALSGPDLPMLQGLFLVFSAAVIVANLAADLLYSYLDPRVRTA